MKSKLSLIFLPFISFSLSGCFAKEETKEDLSHVVNIGEFRGAVNLNYKNFTLTSIQTKNGVESDYTVIKSLDDGSFYQKCRENNSEYYWKRDTDGSFIHISKYEDSWIVDKVVNKLTFETDYYTDDSELLWTINDLIGSYTEFTYNDSSFFYESTINLKGVVSNIALKFNDRKLAKPKILGFRCKRRRWRCNRCKPNLLRWRIHLLAQTIETEINSKTS